MLLFEERRAGKLWGSQIIEDAVHHCKSLEASSNNKRVNDLRLYRCPVHRHVAEGVHNFVPPAAAKASMPMRGARVGKEVFEAPIKRTPACFQGVRGSATPAYFSSSAETRQVPIADLELAKFLLDTKQVDCIQDLDLVTILRGQAGLVIKDKTGYIGNGSWIVPLVMLHTHTPA